MINWAFLGLLALGAKISEFTSARERQTYYEPLKSYHLTPENTVIIFDWHQVLQTQNFAKIGAQLLLKTGFKSWSLLKPRVISKMNELYSQGLIAEKIIDGLIDEFPDLEPLRREFIDIINSQPMIEESVCILRNIKQAGYKIYMLSNIAEETLEELWQKQKDILSIFDGIYTPNKSNGYIKKPHPKFYQYFKNYLTEKGDDKKTLLFIDDRGKNVQAGFNEGIYGIVFLSSKQLEKNLLDLKLLEKEC